MSRSSWRTTYFNRMTIPYWGIHVLALGGIAWLGWSWLGLVLAIALYIPRMFFVTGVYHRYFSHRSYKTSRWFQFLLALGAQTTSQKGVLWWAAHHRQHHKESDQPADLHSPKHDGFWWSHHGWILSRELEDTDMTKIRDFAKYPELRWLNRFWWLPVMAVGAACLLFGGWFAVVWAFAVGTVLVWHGTFTINSLSHLWGGRRYKTTDDSRNNPVLAVITMGEGWHNNHHHYQVAARQGFFWWEIDCTYYILKVLSWFRLIWDLHGVPAHIKKRIAAAAEDSMAPVPQ